jgi:hypothetical protein
MEIYKQIVNYENLYEVSNLGNIKSLEKGDGNGYKTRLLKQEVIKRDHTNYRRVTLSKNGIIKRFQVHRLVALHFIVNIDNKLLVNHIDNNGENNCVPNLEWATQSENMIHADKQGRLLNSQSSGGKASGIISKDKAIIKYDNLIGTVINNWTILNITSIEKHTKCNARCNICSNVYNKNIHDITHKQTIMCKNCYNLSRKKTINIGTNKKVLRYSLDNILIDEFESTSIARNFLINNGYSKKIRIKDCCDNKVKTAHGYIWKYKDDDIVKSV